jgi:hypothetical protein
VATSINHFYDPASTWTRCKIMTIWPASWYCMRRPMLFGTGERIWVSIGLSSSRLMSVTMFKGELPEAFRTKVTP